MLDNITLENYKSFKDSTQIQFKPLTLLCGVNSSGKSSILKSLLMMRQTVENESTSNSISLIGKYVDNGYFDDIVCQNSGNSDSFSFSSTIILKNDENINGKTIPRDKQAFRELKKMYSSACSRDEVDLKKITHFELRHQICISRVNNQGLKKFIDNNRITKTIIEIRVYTEEDGASIEKNSLFTSIILTRRNDDAYKPFYNLEFKNIPTYAGFYSNEEDEENNIVFCYFNNIKLTGIYQDNIKSELWTSISSILSIFNIVSAQYSGSRFLAPLRQYPSRNYVIEGDVDSVGISGENAPVYFTKKMNDKFFYPIAVPVKADNEFVFDLKNKSAYFNEFIDVVNAWCEYLEIGEVSVVGKNGLLSLHIGGRNITDVGFGISQVFPIIVQGLSLTSDEYLLLEQPEIHLHPKMQMRIADFLIALAASGRNVIVETHSDHIINRLIHRYLEYYGSENDLQKFLRIYYITKDDCGHSAATDAIHIHPYKGIEEYPEGFFDQYSDELSAIMRHALNNIQNRKGENCENSI